MSKSVLLSLIAVIALSLLIVNNITGGAITNRLYTILHGQKEEVLGANTASTSNNYPGFVYVIPQLLKAFTENDDIADSETTGGIGIVPNGTAVGQPAAPRPGDGGTEIFKIINNASAAFGIPARLLEGAMRTECGGKFGASDAEILSWSTEGSGIPAAGNQWVSHCYNDSANAGAGPAQFNGVDNFLAYANLANQISGLNRQTLYIENMVDAINAAALKFVLDANDIDPYGITAQEFIQSYKNTQWSCEAVKKTAVCYQQGCGGTPSSYALLKLRTMWYFYIDGNYDASESEIKKPNPC